jgi:hypothetical protein
MSRPPHPVHGGDLPGPDDRGGSSVAPIDPCCGDGALRREATLDRLPSGAGIVLDLAAGLYERRTWPTLADM